MKIEWRYFFGGSSGLYFDRYYKSEIDGVKVEKHSTNRGSTYSVGNIDYAKVRYKTERELIEAIGNQQK